MKYVALLRGINVGGNNKVEMKKLKMVFEEASFGNVLTYINSGNVIFETPEKDTRSIKEKIEKILVHHFGFEIRVLVRSEKEMEKLVKALPERLQNNEEQRTDILFLWDEFDNKKTIEHITINKDVDNLLYLPGAIIWNLKKKDYTKSKMNKFIGTLVYKHMTARNINTVRKLWGMMNS